MTINRAQLEETKKKRNARKKQKKNDGNKSNHTSIVRKKTYLKENGQPLVVYKKNNVYIMIMTKLVEVLA